MADSDDSTSAEIASTRLLVLTIFIATVLVGLNIWETKQKSPGPAKMERAAMDAGQDKKGPRRTQKDGATEDGSGIFQNPIEEEWHWPGSSHEGGRLPRVKVPKGNMRKQNQEKRRGSTESSRSFFSSLETRQWPSSGTLFDVFGPAHEAAEKKKTAHEEEGGALPNSPNQEFLPQLKEETTQSEDIAGLEPHKVFRTTQDGVLHVDYNVNSNDGFRIYDSRNRGDLDQNALKFLGKKVPDGNRSPKAAGTQSKESPSQPVENAMNPQKPQSSSVSKIESPPPKAASIQSEESPSQPVSNAMSPKKPPSSSASKIESPPPAKEPVLLKTHAPHRVCKALSHILVTRPCEPACEAQQYIDDECNDDPDEKKALKKQTITAYLRYRMGEEIFDPYEDEIPQSVENIADTPLRAAAKRLRAKNKTIPAKAANKASNTGLACSSQCMFFSKLPPEIRTLIYRQLLTTRAELNAGAEIEKIASSLTTDDDDPSKISDIDSAVMRTCQRMYHETLPVLYGENKFVFRTPRQLEAFREGNLDRTQDEPHGYRVVPVFNRKGDLNGRLSMVKDILIQLSVTPSYLGDRLAWARLFGDDRIGFPKLEILTLDFTEWTLGDNQGLIVSAVFRLVLF
ncbi:MAG: hypothetical protein Q9195_005004 [Heterodermia aff. obscurata]